MVRPEAMYDRPIPERHRIVFYVGHLEAFDWNLLSGPCGLASFHPEFDRLFAFGIDPVGGGLPSDQPHDWPRLREVNEYRARVRQALDHALETAPAPDDGEGSFGQLLNVAIEHRLMHAETLAYMFHQMPFERKRGRRGARDPGQSRSRPKAFAFPRVARRWGCAAIPRFSAGTTSSSLTTTDVPEFTIDKYKVANGQFLGFVEDGGYHDRSLWTPAGWEWKAAQGISHPVFWARRGNAWAYRSMFDEIPLPLDWPVYASHAEAGAYARWAGKRLPTEAQWHRAAYGAQGAREREYPWGDEWPDIPEPVSTLPPHGTRRR